MFDSIDQLNTASTAAKAVHRITIREVAHNARGPVYDATLGDKVLLPRAREPLFEACRVLAARGVTGVAELWRPGAAAPAMRIDIAIGAGLTVAEADRGRTVIAQWSPREYPTDDAA